MSIENNKSQRPEQEEPDFEKPGQKENQRRLKENNLLMIIFTGVIATTSVVSGIFFYRQLQTMDRQLAVMRSSIKQTDDLIQANNTLAKAASEANKFNREVFIASQRPWVLVNAAVGGPIRYFKGHGMDIRLKLTFENTGHSPAIYVFPALEVYSFEEKKLFNKQSELCHDLKKSKYTESGAFVLFPGEKRTVDRKLYWPQANIVASKTGEVLPVITGCVDYQMLSRQEHYQTGFIYVMELKSSESGVQGVSGSIIMGGYTAIPLRNEPIPETSLYLSPLFFDSRAFFAN